MTSFRVFWCFVALPVAAMAQETYSIDNRSLAPKKEMTLTEGRSQAPEESIVIRTKVLTPKRQVAAPEAKEAPNAAPPPNARPTPMPRRRLNAKDRETTIALIKASEGPYLEDATMLEFNKRLVTQYTTAISGLAKSRNLAFERHFKSQVTIDFFTSDGASRLVSAEEATPTIVGQLMRDGVTQVGPIPFRLEELKRLYGDVIRIELEASR